jgi:hypothetical protein
MGSKSAHIFGAMMNNPSVGSSAKQATQFLLDFHEDVYKLVKKIDELMSQHQWFPADGTERTVAYGLGSSLEATYWVLKFLTRFYETPPTNGNLRGIIILGTDFVPLDFDEPMLLVTAANFPTALSVRTIWENLKPSRPVRHDLAKSPGPRRLADEVLKSEFLPDAYSASAFQIPLCELHGIDDLICRVVDPALGMMSDLSIKQ